jgi:polysaccharide biosynthesis protein PslG
VRNAFQSERLLFRHRNDPQQAVKSQPKRTRARGFSAIFLILSCLLISCGFLAAPAAAQDSLTATPAATQVPLTSKTISANFFGMHMHDGVLGQQPWPGDSFGTMRFWDTNTGWADMNLSEGVYDWTTFDAWLVTAKDHGVTSLLYTFGKVPAWASSKPFDVTCDYGPGECDAPNDLNADGTGTDQHWKDFVRAIATHAAGRVKYWEIWNEPNILSRWTGTNAQLVRMAADARSIILSIDSNAILLTPCPAKGIAGTANWLAAYFSAGGAKYADVIAYHAYVQHAGAYPVAEDVVTLMHNVSNVMAAYGQIGKPMWNTEGSWGKTSVTGFSNPDLEASFAVRYILLQWSNGMSRFYWFQWNNTNSSGVLWEPTAGLLKPGVAYGEVYKWMVGATMSNRCSEASDHTWTCTLTRPGGYQALAIWNPSGTKSYTAPGEYKQYRTIYGQVYSLPASHSMSIGNMPFLLEN